MLSTITCVSLGVVKRLISLCIMVAPFPVGDVSACDGASSHGSRYSVGFGAVVTLVDELEVALGFAHVSPRMCSSVCQCRAIPSWENFAPYRNLIALPRKFL